MNSVSKITAEHNLEKSIENVLEPLGGISQFISKGDRVLLKPNFNTADPPPASTDIHFLRAITQQVLTCNPTSITIGESSTIITNTKKVFEDKGTDELKKIHQTVNVVNFETEKWITKKIPKGKHLKKVAVPEILDHIDTLILLPCLKTHSMAHFTGSLKLSVGFMKPKQRIAMHTGSLQEKIAELNAIIHPDLVIMDGRKCFISGGPEKGELREPNLLLASTDRVALDIEGVKIIKQYEGNSLEGIEAEELTQIQLAKEII